MDRNKLIATLVERLEIKLDKDDPAFVLVELNALVFQELIEPLFDRLDGLSSLPDSLHEKTVILEDQIAQLNASKEMLIAEIALSAKKKITSEIRAEVSSAQEQTNTFFRKALIKQALFLGLILAGVQLMLKFF